MSLAGIVNDQITAERSVPERADSSGFTTSRTIQGDDISSAAQLAGVVDEHFSRIA